MSASEGARSARAISHAVCGKDVSAREAVAAALASMATYDAELQAFTASDAELALSAADEVDRRIASGERPPLAGVAFGVKELIAVAGLPQGYGSAAMPRNVAAHDAACVQSLRVAGAIPVGVTRTSELAWRDDTPPTRNPLDASLSCGGSSGGSGAAVAAGLVPFALGTDTGGSIRVPAALCACCGHKPTFGAVAMDHVLPVSPSLDHVGPLARSVDDVRLALAALTGQEPPPETTMRSASALRLGVPRDAAELSDDPALQEALADVLETLAAAGAELVAVALASLESAYGVVDTISLAEGAKIFADALAAPHGALSDTTRAELEAATSLESDVLAEARAMHAVIGAEMSALLAGDALDAIVLPAVAVPAPLRGARRTGKLRLNLPLALANVTGQPACVLPLQRRPSPLAVQLLGHPQGDDALLAIAALVEMYVGEI